MAKHKARRSVAATEVASELGGLSPGLLRELHLLTRDGAMNADALRKIKQIQHLMQLLAPAVATLQALHSDPLLVDAGAGNGYLGFLLHDTLLRAEGSGHIRAVERRADLVERANARAAALGMTRLRFELGSIAAQLDVPAGGGVGEGSGEAAPDGADPIRGVVALHACDRATDEAIVLGLRHGAELIAVVPCCQAEVAALLQGHRVDGALAPLWRHNLHRRELGAHLTNVLRGLVLEAHGYKVRVTELVGWEHAIKNELIVATRHQLGNAAARRQLTALLAELPPLPMWLLQQTGFAGAADLGDVAAAAAVPATDPESESAS